MQVTFDENPAGPVSISPSAIVKIKTIEGDDYEMSNLVNRMLKFISYKLKFWSHKGVDYFKDYREYKEHAVSPEIAIKSKLPILVKRNYINSIDRFTIWLAHVAKVHLRMILSRCVKRI